MSERAIVPSPTRRGWLAPDVADFAPGLLAIQESPPARMPRLVFYLVGVLFAILFAWSILGRVDIVASAEGKLVPKTFTKIVQPAESGIVRDILVKDGQEVRAGEVLLRMDATTAGADLGTLRSEALLKGLTLRRIAAELRGQPLLMQAGDPPLEFAQVLAQFKARRQAYLDALSQEQATRDKARFELQSAEHILAKLESTLPLYRQAATSYTNLLKDNYVSELETNDKVREKLEKEREAKAQESNVSALRSAITQSDKKIAQIQSSYDSQLRNEQMEAESQSRKASGEVVKQEFRSGLLELKAPQSGVVKDLAITTAGAVVQPGVVLLTIVPRTEPLVAEVAIKNEDVGFVEPGQPAKVKMMAYPFQKYGLMEGVVDNVAADANTADQKQNAGPQTYKAYVRLTDQRLNAPNGDQLKLAPGMSVIAEVQQGQRSVLEYLLSPIQRVGQEAGRER